MSESEGTSVRSEIVMDAPIDRAFAVFTEDMASWWPREHHLIEAELADMIFETRVGGHVYDLGVDGTECRWARVLAYEPPERVLFSWDINMQWQIEEDPAKTSEVEVRFSPVTPEQTRVVLEHRHIDRHGDGWEHMHEAVRSPDGWDGGLQAFSARLEGTTLPRSS
jgi:uncharacterized protein YndB with AHSA1/START domain